MSLHCRFLRGCLALAPILTASVQAQEPVPNPVRAAMQPMALQGGALAGPAAEALLARAGQAQYVLIGEEHGLAESSEFAAALARALRPQGFGVMLAEVGPFAAGEIEPLARAGDLDGLNALYREAPFSIPFFWFTEEFDFARAVVQGEPAGEIWGIDQEFILSPQLHLTRLAEMARSEVELAMASTLAESEQRGLATLVATRDPAKAPLLMFAPPDDLNDLAAHFAQQPEAVARIEALRESQAIYGLFSAGKGHDNNRQRADLMRRQLRERIEAAVRKGGAEPRLIGKFGANHVQRGFSPMHVSDIGNALAERAAWQGRESFHLLLMPVSGNKNMALPFTGLEAAAVPIACEGLVPYDALCRAAGEVEGWRFVDLAALRADLGAVLRFDPKLLPAVLGFDAVVFVGKARPATHVAGNLELFGAAGSP
jgi:hypothetical protein